MARKEMVITQCDSCESETRYEYNKNKGVYIPRGWVHLELKQFSGHLLIQDLCPKCAAPLLAHAAMVENTNVEESNVTSLRDKKILG